MARIGLLGGSFNPVHEGHLNLARAALGFGCVERVLFLPSGVPPHKRETLAGRADRLAMVRLAVEGEADMGVCAEEIDRPGVSYTADTLQILSRRFPDDAFALLLGADALMRLRHWQRADEVVRLCRLLVMMRPDEDETRVRAEARSLCERGAQIGFLEGGLREISSTEIRQRLRAGKTLCGLVPPKVEAYIREHGLYQRKQGGKDIDETRKDGL